MAAISPKKIAGKWTSGYALDIHTISSTHLGLNEYGHDVFDTKRSELGELLYRLKYNSDKSAATEIVEAAFKFVKPSVNKFDLIVPVPPSAARHPPRARARGGPWPACCRVRHDDPCSDSLKGRHGPRNT